MIQRRYTLACRLLLVAGVVGCMGGSGRTPATADSSRALPADAKRQAESIDSSVRPYLKLGGVTVWLDSTTLGEAAHSLALPPGFARYRSDSGVALRCLRVGIGPAVLVSLVGHESADPRVVRVEVSRQVPGWEPTPVCDSMPAGVPLSSSVRLTLGMSAAEAHKIVGRPTEVEVDGGERYGLRAGSGKQQRIVVVYLSFDHNRLVEYTFSLNDEDEEALRDV